MFLLTARQCRSEEGNTRRGEEWGRRCLLGIRELSSIPRGLRLPGDLGQVIELLWEPQCLHLSLLNNFPVTSEGCLMIKGELFSLTHQIMIEQARKILPRGELTVSREQWCRWRYRGTGSKWNREKHQFRGCMKGQEAARAAWAACQG